MLGLHGNCTKLAWLHLGIPDGPHIDVLAGPMAKIPLPKVLNNYRPMALTSLVLKGFKQYLEEGLTGHDRERNWPAPNQVRKAVEGAKATRPAVSASMWKASWRRKSGAAVDGDSGNPASPISFAMLPSGSCSRCANNSISLPFSNYCIRLCHCPKHADCETTHETHFVTPSTT